MLKLSQKLLLFVLAAAVVPLAFAGFWLLREAERELGERLEREQRALAAAAAEATGTQLAVSLESLAQSALLIDWARVTPEEASGGLRLLASQSSVVVGATLVDPARTDVQPFLEAIDERPKLGVSRDALSALLPLATLGSFGDPGQMALGPAQASPEGAWMPAAIQVGPRGPAAPMVVLGLTLTVLDRWLIDHAPTAATLQIIDADGRVVASSAGHPAIAQLEEARLAGVKSNMAVVNTATEQLAFARVPGKLGLTAIAAVPLTVARAPIASLRKSALIGMGGTVLLLIVVSLFFTGGLSRRLGQLGSVAEAFGKGDLSQRASTDGGDELAALGQTFNSMGAELETSRAKLMRWNDELK
ncbi:MAG TPA: HAMP domain-containing protein, partial [Archangium sp.]